MRQLPPAQGADSAAAAAAANAHTHINKTADALIIIMIIAMVKTAMRSLRELFSLHTLAEFFQRSLRTLNHRNLFAKKK